MNRMTRLGSIGLLLGATILIAASQADAQRQPTRRPRGPELKVGQVAPEIGLSPLTFKKSDKGEMVGMIGTKKVKLSTFKGKAPKGKAPKGKAPKTPAEAAKAKPAD